MSIFLGCRIPQSFERWNYLPDRESLHRMIQECPQHEEFSSKSRKLLVSVPIVRLPRDTAIHAISAEALPLMMLIKNNCEL